MESEHVQGHNELRVVRNTVDSAAQQSRTLLRGADNLKHRRPVDLMPLIKEPSLASSCRLKHIVQHDTDHAEQRTQEKA